MRSITLLYKCHCLKEEASFEMRSRLPDEDIMDYMERVQMAVGVDHNNRSPLCVAKAMEYLKIPVEEGLGIGEVSGGTA